MNDNALLEPVKAYKTVYKQAVNDEANRFFDELVGKSGIDIEANKQTIKEIKKTQKQIDAANKKHASLITQKVFLIIGAVFFFLLAIACIVAFFFADTIPLYVSIPLLPVSIGLGIWFIFIVIKNINPKIKAVEKEKEALNEKLQGLLEAANAQMAPLNALYDWNMAMTIIENVIPILDFDKYFDGGKYSKLCTDYGFSDLGDENTSILAVQSGNILGNPFIFQKQKVHGIYDKAYTGSITISWTEYYRDSEGNRRSRTRTQVLTATTYHPAPKYTSEAALIYGNHAAPDLSFTRKPSGLDHLDDKKLAKYVERNTDDLYKKAEKSLQSGAKNVFTPLANSEFELLFGALDRDHDVQFRLLFTPLGQTNMTNLIRSKEGYGDDFYFYKNKRINTISSAHLQGVDLSGSPHIFIGYDYELARQKFVDHVNNIFKVIYFDFAPLLSIPLYQQLKTIDYIYGEDAPTNFSNYEHEVFANTFDDRLLAHPETITDVIYKTKFLSKDGKSDKFNITAHSYKGEPRVDYVSKMGGDGHMHTIPVHWTEYIPIAQTTTMELKDVGASRARFNQMMDGGPLRDFVANKSNGGYYSFQRGIIALLVNEAYGKDEDKTLDSIFRQKDE